MYQRLLRVFTVNKRAQVNKYLPEKVLVRLLNATKDENVTNKVTGLIEDNAMKVSSKNITV